MKRCTFFLMVFVLILSASAGGGAMASEVESISDVVDYLDISPHASQFLASYGATARRASSGVLTITFIVDATTRFERVGVLTIAIQQRNGNTWRNVATFAHSTARDMMGQNVWGHDGTVTHNGIAGMEYRATVVFFAGHVSGGGGQRTVVTSSVTL